MARGVSRRGNGLAFEICDTGRRGDAFSSHRNERGFGLLAAAIASARPAGMRGSLASGVGFMGRADATPRAGFAAAAVTREVSGRGRPYRGLWPTASRGGINNEKRTDARA